MGFAARSRAEILSKDVNLPPPTPELELISVAGIHLDFVKIILVYMHFERRE
jgi:hypothetical protein